MISLYKVRDIITWKILAVTNKTYFPHIFGHILGNLIILRKVHTAGRIVNVSNN